MAISIPTGAAIVCLAAVTGGPALADVFHVYEGESIQEAINAGNHGDEIIVHPGTYYEAIGFYLRAVWLHSSDGPEVTIINATGLNDSVVKCLWGEGPDSILEGFTLTGGSGSDRGD